MIFANELEFSPFSQKGGNAIALVVEQLKKFVSPDQLETIKKDLQSEEFFFNKFYVPPFTRYCEKELCPDDEFDYDTIHSALIEKYNEFIKYLKANIYHMCWLYGSAGCGKTTYIHKLKRELKNAIVDIYDFENVDKRVQFHYNGECYEIGNNDLWDTHHCYKFSIMLIGGLFNNLQLEQGLSDGKMSFIKKVIKVYDMLKNDKNDIDIVRKFFARLKAVVNEKTVSSVNEFKQFFIDLIDNEELYKTEICKPIVSLMYIMSVVLACVGTFIDKRMIIAFDNIEYYVRVVFDEAGGKIPDKTIEIILKSVLYSIDKSMDIFNSWEFTHVPCVLVSTRPATVTFNHNGQGPNQHSIDVTKWFWAKEIYENKVNYLDKHVKGSLKLLYKLLTDILADCTTSSWSLGIILPRMFNYDYRRLCRVVLKALKKGLVFKNIEKFKYNCNRLMQIWNDSRVSLGNNTGIRHLCRIYILRMLLDIFNENIDENNIKNNQPFFNRLMFVYNSSVSEDKLDNNKTLEYNSGRNKSDIIDYNWISTNIKNLICHENNQYGSYVRKILTILHNYELQYDIDTHNNNDDDNINIIRYISFETLLKELYLKGNHSSIALITDNKLYNLGSILYAMNRYTDKVNWVPLTTIKWNCDAQNYSSTEIVNALKRARENIRNSFEDDKNYGIKINPAGQVLLKLLPEFEFFDLRYCPRYESLFDDGAMKKKNGKWVAEIIIDNILANAIKCINTIIRDDIDEFSLYGNNNIDFDKLYTTKWVYKDSELSVGFSHVARILDQHINYLLSYRDFVVVLSPNAHRFTDIGERKELLDIIEEKIKMYKYCQKKYMEFYANYFRRV